jgi:RNA polymerase sigma-70 factor (ECF subfamily)
MAQNHPPDAEIVDQVKSGNTKEFRILVDRYLPGLTGFFHYIRVPEDMVDDMVQETFMRAYEKIALFDTGRSFMTWITVVGRNIFYKEIKRRGRKLPESEPAELVTQCEDNMVIARETARELLDHLDEPSRFLVELRVFNDLSFAEIADITGDPLPTLRVRFHRLLNRLRLVAKKEGTYES